MNYTDEQVTAGWELINDYEMTPTHTDCDGVKQVAVYEVANFFYQIPDGMVTTWDDVRAYFMQKYGNRIALRLSTKIDSEIPYWKALSARGYLEDYGRYYSKDIQRKNLEAIGIEVDEKNHVVDFKNKHFKISYV